MVKLSDLKVGSQVRAVVSKVLNEDYPEYAIVEGSEYLVVALDEGCDEGLEVGVENEDTSVWVSTTDIELVQEGDAE